MNVSVLREPLLYVLVVLRVVRTPAGRVLVARVPDGRLPTGRVLPALVPAGRALVPSVVVRGVRLLGLGFEKSFRFVDSSGSVLTCALGAPSLRGVFKSLGGLEVSFNAAISSLVRGR